RKGRHTDHSSPGRVVPADGETVERVRLRSGRYQHQVIDLERRLHCGGVPVTGHRRLDKSLGLAKAFAVAAPAGSVVASSAG
ncbi:MAG: hypothetical protein WBV74_13080, partial [Pseudonocardiaceae bacterium]